MSDIAKLENIYRRQNALKKNGGIIAPMTDYHDTACEQARLLLIYNYQRGEIYKNLRAVYSEYHLFNCENSHDPGKCRSDIWEWVLEDFRKYCEYVRIMDGQPPTTVKHVRFPS